MIDGNTALNLTQRDIRELSGGRRYVFEVMKTGGWWTYHEVQKEVANRFNAFFSENCISARIRDMRKPEFGGHSVERRIRCGRTYEYQLEIRS